MPMFLCAMDSFKGTLSSAHASELLVEVARRSFPSARLRQVMVADGGEGTVDAVVAATGGERIAVEVEGPRGALIRAVYGMLSGHHALIEMAAASGLPLIPASERDPRLTSTFGTGQLIKDALDRGATDISLAIGGSATNDGGMGAMRALGARFLDAQRHELVGTGADLARVASIDLSTMDPRIAQTHFHVMCDVDNPLVGARGATAVFAPQKGATTEIVATLEAGMRSFAHVLTATFGEDVSDMPGMGAAGGLGAAAHLFLHADVVSGIEQVLDLVEFDRMLVGVDLCITGEGHADAQSAHGKVISGVAARCGVAGVPCIAVVGAMDVTATELLDQGIAALIPTVIECGSEEDALIHAERNFILAAERTFALLRLGQGLAR